MGQSQISVPFFESLKVSQLEPDTFDAALVAETEAITAIFFWGHDCPNCEVAKRMLHQDAELVRELNFRWYHVNVYDHPELGTRFGLHGIPTFLFFHRGKKLGRISPFPGMEPFMTALRDLRHKHLGS
ncbi:MAG: thioredoxin family protein [Bdellovibrionaceae bacterium]|nr:thioredoxin family protein [Pseudobdellovibrionaceae bacterium]